MIEQTLFFNGRRIDELCAAEAREALADIAVEATRGVNHPYEIVKRLYSIGYGVNYIVNPSMEHSGWESGNALSIFSGMSDKEALRAMADECARRGLSIMVNMELESTGDKTTITAINAMNCFVTRNVFKNIHFYDVDSTRMALSGEPVKASKDADKAFAKIMKTIKDYQDRIK